MLLLIEDDAITRTAMAETLRTSGEPVLEADNGEQALELLAANPTIKLVVMDFVLPDVDGLKLMDLIHQRRPRVPIILVSGYLSQRAGDAIVGTTTRNKAYLAKPVRPSALVRAVKDLLRAA